MRWSFSARARYLALALAAALLAGVFVYLYLDGLARRAPVLVASRDFGAYTTLDAGLVETVYFPAVAVLPGAVVDAADAVGLVSLVPRAAGEQIQAATLAGGENPGEFRAGLGAEERALYLPADSVRGGWLGVARGDFVDLTVVFQEGQAFCLGQGVQVLEVLAEPGDAPLIGGRVPATAGVLLRVTPPLAERLALAVECGQVYFSVAGYAAIPVPTSGAWLDQLYEGGEVPVEPDWP